MQCALPLLSVYTAISSASREVIGGLSAAEATNFLEKIENLNKRWKGVLAELAARRERFVRGRGDICSGWEINSVFNV